MFLQLILALLLVSCGGAARQSCYAVHEARAVAEIDRACPGDIDTCEALPEILERLTREQESCP